MKRFIKNKPVWLIVGATIIIAIIIGIFAAADRKATTIEKIGGEALAPVQNAVSESGNWFTDLFSGFGSVKKLKEENALLKAENTNLQGQISELKSLEKENDKLRLMLDLKKTETRVDMVAADIVSKNPSNWYSTFTINKGVNDGIEQNQAVVNANREVIGQVSKVGDSFAEVITVLDSQSSLGVCILRSKEIGILEGDANLRYKGACRLSYIGRDTDIQTGDLIATSGLGGIFPKGLLVGTVTEMRDENSTMSKVATIKPFADISKETQVFVITDYDEFDLTIEVEDEEEVETDEEAYEDEEE